MRKLLLQSLGLIVAEASLIAQVPVWTSKPAAQWTDEDARQILDRSPWAKEIRATITRRLTEDQLRDGGQMGQPRGVGNENVDPKGSGEKVALDIFTGPGGDDRSFRSLSHPISLKLRWESALPVRLAELKSHEVAPLTLDGEGYRIAVYGIPNANFKGDPKELGKPLKGLAALKREGKKDVKPSSVEVFQLEGGVVVVYLFPLSAEITRKDRQIQFEAQIGRIVVNYTFDLREMEFMGNLEL
ncbi:MAG: hypothetical protein ABSH42_01025 [Bryobacteraceae bacterium]|jgi:hypothetical protein